MLLLLALVACCLPLPGSSGGKKSSGPIHLAPAHPRVERPGARPRDDRPGPIDPADPNEPPVSMDRQNCEDLKDGGAVKGPDCVTDEVRCGQTVFGHTRGGTATFDSKFYERHKCTPRTTNHDDGGERTYLLRMPDGDHRVSVWLDTPCADLDLTMMTSVDDDHCPTVDSLVKVCDMWPKDGTKREHVEFATQGATDLLIVVEGKNKDEGAFGLTIQCKDGLY